MSYYRHRRAAAVFVAFHPEHGYSWGDIWTDGPERELGEGWVWHRFAADKENPETYVTPEQIVPLEERSPLDKWAYLTERHITREYRMLTINEHEAREIEKHMLVARSKP